MNKTTNKQKLAGRPAGPPRVPAPPGASRTSGPRRESRLCAVVVIIIIISSSSSSVST